jgi:MFS transporter, DHA1 family, inner membrane transport protein
VTITAGLGYTSPIWAGAGTTLLGLTVMALAAAGAKRIEARRPPRVQASATEQASAIEQAAVEPAAAR